LTSAASLIAEPIPCCLAIANPDLTSATLPVALQPTSTALPIVLTVYKGELYSLEYDLTLIPYYYLTSAALPVAD
jgi:hypothetical protein